MNGEPIHVSGAKRLADCLVDVGTNPSQREAADRTFRCLRAVYDRCHDVPPGGGGLCGSVLCGGGAG